MVEVAEQRGYWVKKYVEVEVRVLGIPAIARVYGFHHDRESWSEWDGGEPGSYSFNYFLYDRRGYKAGWLEAKVERQSSVVRSRVDDDICEQIIGELG